MTTVIGMEYLIGNAFIYSTEERFLSLQKINDFSAKMQKYWYLKGIDAVIKGSVAYVANNFDDYFEFNKEASLIVLKSNVTKEDLKQRFVGYLPLEILLSFEEGLCSS